MRDEFPADVVDLLARRVGVRCSNPNCRQTTCGPRTDPTKSINVGVAAHITAASAGGPRYEGGLSSDQRRSAENGIWLCQTCAKLVDNDPPRYTIELLRQWRRLAEEAALLAIEQPSSESATGTTDADLVRFFAQCFDRPAFQDHFRQEGSMEAFDKAVEDTITAINTGCLRSRDGGVLATSRGKAFLRDRDWRLTMDEVVDLLRAIRSRFDGARREKLIHVSEGESGQVWCCFNDPDVAEWMDRTRGQVMAVFAKVCQAAGVVPPSFPRPRRTVW